MTEPTNGGIVPATTTAAPQTIQEVPRAMPAIARPPIPAGAAPRGIVPTSFDEVKRMAAMAVEAGLMKGEDKSAAVAQAGMIILKGLELGMTPTMALDIIANINGRNCIWGKGVPALIRGRGHKIEEWETGTRMADDWTFHCRITRGDTGEVIERSFSVLDAKQAGLWSQEAKITRSGRSGPYTKENDSPWYRFPQRMLPARARGYAAADGAPEALLGMYLAEEMQDVVRAEERIQEEERGQIGVAPPPPLLNPEPEPAQPTDGSVASVDVPEQGAEPEGAGNQPDSASEEVATAPSEDAIQLAAVSCASAMIRANTIERLDQLMGKFNEKFDGHISKKIADELEVTYENAFDRIAGAGVG